MPDAFRPRPALPSGPAGFALLDAIVAAGLAAAALGGLVQLHVLQARAVLDAGFESRALGLAIEQVERLRSTPVASLPLGRAVVELVDEAGRPVVAARSAQGVTFTRRSTVEAVASRPDLVRVEVGVWLSPRSSDDLGVEAALVVLRSMRALPPAPAPGAP